MDKDMNILRVGHMLFVVVDPRVNKLVLLLDDRKYG